jgi:hypothetical protein
VHVNADGKKGHHKQKNVDVAVDCKADGMTWDYDHGGKHFHHDGNFDGEDFGLPDEDHVTGTCTITSLTKAKGKKKKLDDETWDGTKTT